MTDVAADRSPSEPDGSPGAPKRRFPRWGLPVALVVVLAIGGLIVWRVVAQAALDGVHVRVSGYHCEGDGVKVHSRPRVTTVDTAEDMRCTFTVKVKNGGHRDIRLGELRASAMGPETGAVVRAESIAGTTPHGTLTNTDAVLVLDRIVPSGGTTSFDIVVVPNPDSCNYDLTVTLFNFPQIEASTLGVDRVIGGPRFGFHNAINNPDCDNLE